MPQPGKVEDEGGRGAQTTLGTVKDTGEKTHFFLNTANLKKDEPVLFDIQAFDLEIDNENVKVSIAILEKGSDGKPEMGKKPWQKGFKGKWDIAWDKVSDGDISKLGMKKNGKPMDKKEILNMDESY